MRWRALWCSSALALAPQACMLLDEPSNVRPDAALAAGGNGGAEPNMAGAGVGNPKPPASAESGAGGSDEMPSVSEPSDAGSADGGALPMSAAGQPGAGGAAAGSGGMGTAAGGSHESAAGASGTASAGGSGGGAAATLELIDDFEDGDNLLTQSHGRNGPWYLFNDGSIGGVQTQTFVTALTGSNARAGSSEGAHVQAHGFTNFGAGIGADFVTVAGQRLPYDVSAYRGFLFYAKVGAGSTALMKLLVPTTYSDMQGGKCNDTAPLQRCDDHLFATFSLSTTWASYQVAFKDLVQQGFGLSQKSLDPTSVYGIEFLLSDNATPVDVWLDDVSFIPK